MRDNAVPNVTSSAKFTWPLARKAATSAPAVLMEGRMGKIGLLHVCIFSCNTSYISNMVTSPGVPKIARTASILSNFSSQYSRQRRKWSGVPVARISSDFLQLHRGRVYFSIRPQPGLPAWAHSVRLYSAHQSA